MTDWSEPHGKENQAIGSREEGANTKRLFPALTVFSP